MPSPEGYEALPEGAGEGSGGLLLGARSPCSALLSPRQSRHCCRRQCCRRSLSALPRPADDAHTHLPHPRQPTYTQPPAVQQEAQQPQQPAAIGGPASGLAAAPALGVPAYHLPQHGRPQHPQQQQRPQQSVHSFPPYLGDLPPSAEEEWERATVLVSVWLGCSAATLAVSLLTANLLAIIGTLCATLGAATHRFPWCRPGALAGDLGALVNRVFGMAVAAACLCSLIALFSLLIAFGLSAS